MKVEAEKKRAHEEKERADKETERAEALKKELCELRLKSENPSLGEAI